jgi:hypothetical protein
MTNLVFADSTRILLLSLLSFLFVEVQTLQEQAIIGTPLLVPEPKKLIRRFEFVTR